MKFTRIGARKARAKIALGLESRILLGFSHEEQRKSKKECTTSTQKKKTKERSHLKREEINFLILKSKLHQTVKPKTPT